MARGHKPNSKCEWTHDNFDNDFEEWCVNENHKRRSRKRTHSDHYHYRCRFCKEITDDFIDYAHCPNEYCDLYRAVIEGMEEVKQLANEA